MKELLWLRRNRVLLPGVSVLARMVAGIRDSAAERMHRTVADAAGAADMALPSRLHGHHTHANVCTC